MVGWNFADVFEVVASEVPDAPALIRGEHRMTWSELDRRSAAVAAHFVEAGLQRQDKVAQYLPNVLEFLESLVASVKGAFVPVNTNYRYGPDELVYLWDNANVAAVVFHQPYAATIDKMRDRVPGVKTWLCVGDEGDACPPWATPYGQVAAADASTPLAASRDRSGDDLLLMYTGGTTGMPKGVMWRQDDLFVQLGNSTGGNYPDESDLDYARSRIGRPGRRHLPAAPLMHGAGCFTCLPVLARGGTIVLLEKLTFDPIGLLDSVERHRVNSIMWVGDAFAKPVLSALDAHPGRWDLTSLTKITSGGVLFSDEVKRGILDHAPHVVIADVFGASETGTLGTSVSRSAESGAGNGRFRPRTETRVISPDGCDVEPGSGVAGLLAFGGRQPLGYYRDADKTAATFRVIDGRRYAVPGDWATVDADGTVTLLGRGSACINTGGEKVFPDEVEAVLKRHPTVYDAVVLGVPDERFGESVFAVVESVPGAAVDIGELGDFVKHHLAGYKAPRQVLVVDSVGRGPNGKVDLAAVTRLALAHILEK